MKSPSVGRWQKILNYFLNLDESPASLTPEIRLWAAVLERAVKDAKGFVNDIKYQSRSNRLRIMKSSYQWFKKRNPAMVEICTSIGLDPEVVREKALKEIEKFYFQKLTLLLLLLQFLTGGRETQQNSRPMDFRSLELWRSILSRNLQALSSILA